MSVLAERPDELSHSARASAAQELKTIRQPDSISTILCTAQFELEGFVAMDEYSVRHSAGLVLRADAPAETGL